MAQRKAKEPLLAEVPRPRLSDEELMELFYSGQRKETERQNDEGDGSGTGTVAVDSVRDSISPKLDRGEPSLVEGYSQEPSNKGPLTNEPSQSALSVGDRQPLDKPTQSLNIEQTVQKRFAP